MSRLVVVSNRVPVTRDLRTIQGGLAVAVLAAMQRRGGLWFGWDGKLTEAAPGRAAIVRHGDIQFATVSLARHDYEQYYRGYANRVIWPLFHERLNLVQYRREYEEGYLRVNALFARKLLPLLRDDDVIWVHDYHLFPLATQLRQAGLRNLIGFFLHVPFPPFDVLRALPRYGQFLHGIAAYDLVGFQTPQDAHAFTDAVAQAMPEARARRGAVRIGQRETRIGAFPISIDIEEAMRRAASGRRSSHGKRLQASLRGRRLIIGVDRLDYSKGLEDRFRAYEQMLAKYPAHHTRVVYLQIAQPSRNDVPEYQQIRHALDRLAGEINGRFADYDWVPLRYLAKGLGRGTVLGFLSIAHVGLITPLRDGMNLVAKEYVIAQPREDPGVLVLSELAGAASELDAALIVNPYDHDDVADALARAIAMPREERVERWQALHDTIVANDVHHWCTRFLRALAARARSMGP